MMSYHRSQQRTDALSCRIRFLRRYIAKQEDNRLLFGNPGPTLNKAREELADALKEQEESDQIVCTNGRGKKYY